MAGFAQLDTTSQDCADAKASPPANHHTSCWRVRNTPSYSASVENDYGLPSSYSRSTCPHHEQSQVLKDTGGNLQR